MSLGRAPRVIGVLRGDAGGLRGDAGGLRGDPGAVILLRSHLIAQSCPWAGLHRCHRSPRMAASRGKGADDAGRALEQGNPDAPAQARALHRAYRVRLRAITSAGARTLRTQGVVIAARRASILVLAPASPQRERGPAPCQCSG